LFHVVTRAPEEGGVREAAAEALDKAGGIEITGSLAGRNQDLGGHQGLV
jgi:hypothetical protein